MARAVRATQAALTKARKRRLTLDAERDERDRRVEQAAADVFVLLDERADAVAKVTEIDEQIGCAVRRIAAEGLTLVDVSALLELDLAHVRKLARASAPHVDQGAPTGAGAEGDGVTPRPGDEHDAGHPVSFAAGSREILRLERSR